MAPIITLTSDFGLQDAYVGAMRGVLLGICPGAALADITHMVPAQDVVHGAWALRDAAPFFPAGAVHLAVVDPGVGGPRRAIIARAGGHLLVGPDNGLLVPAAEALGGVERAWQIDPGRLGARAPRARSPSATFHGRDIFAPAAGWLASGVDPEALGDAVEGLLPLPAPAPQVSLGRILGRIMTADHFGNLTTNVPASAIPDRARARVTLIDRAQPAIEGLSRTYGDAAVGQVMALAGSSGYIEIAVNQGSARARLGADPGDAVEIALSFGDADVPDKP